MSAQGDEPFSWAVESNPALADLAIIEDRLATAAVAAAGLGEVRDLAVFVRDAADRIVAGICGTTWGGYCELSAMWVDEPLRLRGYGRRLMAEAEGEAARRGCLLVTFLAYDLLAPNYERWGYQTAGVVDDVPTGSAARWFVKRLDGPQASAAPSP